MEENNEEIIDEVITNDEPQMITIRVYDAVRNIYYDKQVPYVEPEEPVEEISNDDIIDLLLEQEERITLLEFGGIE